MQKYELENDAIEFAELEREAEFYPFENHREYLHALIRYSHPAHNIAMRLYNERKVAGIIKLHADVSEDTQRKLLQYEAVRELQAIGEY